MDILIVEDEKSVREELLELVNVWGHKVSAVACAEEALQYLKEFSVDLVLFDINMPGTNGLEMLTELRADPSNGKSLKAICMTGEQDPNFMLTALKSGISDFLFKPIDPSTLKLAMSKVELDIKTTRSQSSVFSALKDELAMKNQLLKEATYQLCEAQRESLICLAHAAEHKDATTGAHLSRISAYARRMGELIGWSEDRCHALELAAPLHDVGKIGIPDELLLKKGRLTPSEYEVMKRHTILGKQILSRSSSPVMRLGAKIALYHHEAFDGSGYPNGLEGNQIPLEAAITSLVDVYDALRSSRPYKDSMANSSAVDIICNGDDRTNVAQFNPELLFTFLKYHQEFDEIYLRCSGDEVSPGLGQQPHAGVPQAQVIPDNKGVSRFQIVTAS